MEFKADQVAPSPPLTTLSTPVSNTQPTVPWPQYFVSRSDGTLTPLIAVDELPSSVRIVGVPAVISQAETINMMSLGVKERSQAKYILEMLDSSTGRISKCSNSTESIPRVLEEQIPILKPAAKAKLGVKNVEEWQDGNDETQATIDAVLAANDKSAEAPTSGTPNPSTLCTFGKKIYCTHWIRWGECDYMQQGCLYKHEMPDEQTLIAIGIRAVPKWYRDKNAPKNGWAGRPAPADQVWRVRPSVRAEEDQTFYPVQPTGPVYQFQAHQPAPIPRVPAGTTGFDDFIHQKLAAPRPRYFDHGVEPRSRLATTNSPYSYQPNHSSATTTSAPLSSAHPTSESFPFASPTPSSAAILPASLAPTHRSLRPFLSSPQSFHSPPPSVPEIKTPAPRHRRLFVAAGEPRFVSNPRPNEGKPKSMRREKGGMKGDRRGGHGFVGRKAGPGLERGNGEEELLVDI